MRSEPANLPVVLAAISGEGLSESELYTIGYYAVRNKMGGLKVFRFRIRSAANSAR